MYSLYSFWHALISSHCAFLSFFALALVGFILLHMHAVLTLFCFVFFLVSSRNFMFGSYFGWFTFCCWCYVSIAEILVFVIWSKYFGYLLMNIEFVTHCSCTFIANIFIVNRGLIIFFGFGCLCLIPVHRRIFILTIL